MAAETYSTNPYGGFGSEEDPYNTNPGGKILS